MSIQLIVAGGFLFLGGILLQILNLSHNMEILAAALSILGIIPLLACYYRTYRGWLDKHPPVDQDQNKEEHHEDH